MAQCIRLGWRRCSPLNWALAHTYHKPALVFCYGISVQWPFALV
ncbi:C4-dicarboxylate ABC transporter [Vibrio cholerae]|nr:C4-dicarboxylate ABC transporter [Vibrio cholerae]